MQKYSALFTDVPAGMINHATMNETAKITDNIFIWHVRCICRWRLYIWPEGCHVRYITKKVDTYTWLPFVMHLKFYLLRTVQLQFVLYILQAQCSLRLTPQCCCICVVSVHCDIWSVKHQPTQGIKTKITNWSFGPHLLPENKSGQ